MDEVSTLKRLVLIKQLYLEGVEKSRSQYNYVDSLLAAINLFLAVETMMGAVVLSVDEQPQKAVGTKGFSAGKAPSAEQVHNFEIAHRNFNQLFDQNVAILRDAGYLGIDERLFSYSRIERLQKARNDAQHGARAPNHIDLPELTAIATDFLNRLMALYFSRWGTTIFEISQADLLGDIVLRSFMKEAYSALNEAKFRECALLCRIAFLLGRLKRRFDWWEDRQGHRLIDDYDDSQSISRNWGTRHLQSNQDWLEYQVMTQASKLPRLYDSWRLGLDEFEREKLSGVTPRFAHYSDNVRGIPPSDEVLVLSALDNLLHSGKLESKPHYSRNIERDDCVWASDFVTNTLLRWQREENGRNANVDAKYLDAIALLVNVF